MLNDNIKLQSLMNASQQQSLKPGSVSSCMKQEPQSQSS